MSPFRSRSHRFRLPWKSVEQIRSEVDEELAFHFDMRTDEFLREGLSPAAARERAEREFGDVGEARHSLRKTDEGTERRRRLSQWLDELRQDSRFAIRGFLRNPTFTAIAVLTLAVAIGGATAIFSLVDGVLLKALPISEQDEVVLIEKELREDRSILPFPNPDIAAFRTQTRAFESVAGVQYDGAFTSSFHDGERVLRIHATQVSGGFFDVIGMRPLLGRFPEEEEFQGGPPEAVITEKVWRRDFGAEPDVVGRILRVRGLEIRIAAVAPSGFELPRGVEMWVAMPPPPDALTDRRSSVYSLIGRLRPGVTLEQAQAEASAFVRQRETIYEPWEVRGQRAVLSPVQEAIVRDSRLGLLTLFTAVGLLLLIATVNVANLLLIRGARRERELAVRGALGAGRWRIIRQLFLEHVLLAVLASVLGVLLAFGALKGVLGFAPIDLPRLSEVRIDARVLWFSLVLSAAVALVFGLFPAIWSARVDLFSSLRSGIRVASERRGIRRGKQMLVVGQVALALVLVAGAGLLARSLMRLQTVDVGFDAPQLTLVSIGLPTEIYDAEDRATIPFFERLVERLDGIRDIEAATPIISAPFSGLSGWTAFFAAEGQGVDEAAANPGLSYEPIFPHYFETFGLPILRGRGFTPQDREDGERVAVVSSSLARRAWPGEDAIGKRLKHGGADSQEPWMTVVGVVADTRYRDLLHPPPTLYVPIGQSRLDARWLAVRTNLDPDQVLSLVRNISSQIVPAASVDRVQAMPVFISQQLARPRFQTLLLSTCAGIALLLAALGLYGVIAFSVAQRAHEIGIRMALGATAGDVRRLVLTEGMLLALIGAAIGTVGALTSTRVLRSVLFEISPTDPATLACVIAVLLTVALAASYVPARRATRGDPMEVLRTE